jgi:hypothetical protein
MIRRVTGLAVVELQFLYTRGVQRTGLVARIDIVTPWFLKRDSLKNPVQTKSQFMSLNQRLVNKASF